MYGDYGWAANTSGGNDFLNGGAGNDTIYGQGGDDTVIGGSGDDSLFGDGVFSFNQGNDVIFGGTGNDTIDGGGGSDIALFTGNRAAYTITWDAGNSRYNVVVPMDRIRLGMSSSWSSKMKC